MESPFLMMNYTELYGFKNLTILRGAAETCLFNLFLLETLSQLLTFVIVEGVGAEGLWKMSSITFPL